MGQDRWSAVDGAPLADASGYDGRGQMERGGRGSLADASGYDGTGQMERGGRGSLADASGYDKSGGHDRRVVVTRDVPHSTRP